MKSFLLIFVCCFLSFNIANADKVTDSTKFGLDPKLSDLNLKTIEDSKITRIQLKAHLRNVYLCPSEKDWLSPQPPQYDNLNRTLLLEWKIPSVKRKSHSRFLRGMYTLSSDGKKLKIQQEIYEIQAPLNTGIKCWELETNTPYCFKLENKVLIFRIDNKNNLINCCSVDINHPQEELQLYPKLTGVIIGVF